MKHRPSPANTAVREENRATAAKAGSSASKAPVLKEGEGPLERVEVTKEGGRLLEREKEGENVSSQVLIDIKSKGERDGAAPVLRESKGRVAKSSQVTMAKRESHSEGRREKGRRAAQPVGAEVGEDGGEEGTPETGKRAAVSGSQSAGATCVAGSKGEEEAELNSDPGQDELSAADKDLGEDVAGGMAGGRLGRRRRSRRKQEGGGSVRRRQRRVLSFSSDSSGGSRSDAEEEKEQETPSVEDVTSDAGQRRCKRRWQHEASAVRERRREEAPSPKRQREARGRKAAHRERVVTSPVVTR